MAAMRRGRSTRRRGCHRWNRPNGIRSPDIMRSNLLAGKLARPLRAHRRRDHNHPMVLVYHRVSRAVTDPQLLSVTPERFAEHLDFLFRRFRPVRLRDLVTATRDGRPPAGAGAITFDDGYADNLATAKPLLE